MLLRKLLKNRGLGMNLLVGLCLVGMLVYGWNLQWREVGIYLLALLIVLGGIIAAAALVGGLLYWLRRRAAARRRDESTPES